jgi:predicted ATPase
MEQPAGTVTLVFTDIEGSTRLLHELGPDAYREALAEHRRIVREAFADGYEVDYEGDAFFYAFTAAEAAVQAVADAQKRLEGGPIRIRVGIHTGEPVPDPPKYVGLDVHLAARVMSVGHGGQALMSKATRELVDADVSDLGEHRLKDIEEPVWLYQLGNGPFPPLKSLNNTNLPTLLGPLIGRESELAELGTLVREGRRLLTLTGAGGTGKTRLAVHLAADLVPEFPNGVFFVSLAPLADPSLVASAIATPLGVRESRGETLETALVNHVRGKRMLLVLDNFEHLLDAAGLVSALLRGTGGLAVIATSRERLHLADEHEYPLAPLEVDDAVELFTERARAADPAFDPTADVPAICDRLDGLPLAIELAASRVRLLPPAQLLARLEQRLPLLTGGARDLPERQQTLRATIEWSYDLLDEHEQSLFARLGVFAGGFTLEDAEAVCDAGLDDVASLLDKSLLRRSQRDETWFFMLETIRELALERLGEDEDVRRRHAERMLELAQESSVGLKGPEQLEWSRRMDAQLDNLRAALAWTLGADRELALALADAAYYCRYARGLWREALQSLESAIAAAGTAADPIVRARAVVEAGWIALNLDEYDHARLRMDEAYELARATGDPGVTAFMLCSRVFLVAWADGDLEEAWRLAEESIAIARESGDRWLLAECLNNATVPKLSDPVAALALLEESLEIYRAVGDRDRVAYALHNVAWVCLEFDLPRSEESAAEALAIAREHGSTRVAAGASIFLGFAVALRGDPAGAELFFGEGLRLAHEVGSQRLVIEAIEGLAAAAADEGDDERARTLWAAGDHALDTLHIPHLYPEEELRRRWFEPRHAGGSPLPLDQTVDAYLMQSEVRSAS